MLLIVTKTPTVFIKLGTYTKDEKTSPTESSGVNPPPLFNFSTAILHIKNVSQRFNNQDFKMALLTWKSHLHSLAH